MHQAGAVIGTNWWWRRQPCEPVHCRANDNTDWVESGVLINASSTASRISRGADLNIIVNDRCADLWGFYDGLPVVAAEAARNESVSDHWVCGSNDTVSGLVLVIRMVRWSGPRQRSVLK